MLVFFFVLSPLCLWLSLFFGPVCPRPWRCGFFLCGPSASLLSVRSRPVCVSSLAFGCSLVFAPPPRPLSWLLPPPPPLFGVLFFSLGAAFFFPLFRSFVVSAPAVFCFLWFPVPAALCLGAVCCLFWWSPSSRLAVRSRLFFVHHCVTLALSSSCFLCFSPASPSPLPRCFSTASFFWPLLLLPVAPAAYSAPEVSVRGASTAACLWMLQSRGRVFLLLCPPRTIQSGAFGRLLPLLPLVLGPWCLGPWRFVLPSSPPPGLWFFFVRFLGLWLSLVSGPGRPRPWRCVLFVLLASRLSALRALSPRLCIPPGRWLLLVGCCPPPRSCLAVFVAAFRCSFLFLRCAPRLSLAFAAFRPRVTWALALFFFFVGLPLLCSLCALASFACPASPLAALWWLLRPPPLPSGGCCPPSRPLFGALSSSLGFLFFALLFLRCLCPRCLLLPLVFGPGRPWPWRCVLFVLVVSLFSARCALSPLLCFPPGRMLLLGGCCTPPPLCLPVFFASSQSGFFFFFVRPRVSGFLCFPSLGALICFVGLPLFGLLLALASFVFPVWPSATLGWLLSPPPLCVSRFSSRPVCPGFFLFVFFGAPPCLWLSLVSGPACPWPWRCVLFVLLASRFSARRALSSHLCSPAGRWLLSGGCCPPPPSFSVSRFSSLPLGARFFFVLSIIIIMLSIIIVYSHCITSLILNRQLFMHFMYVCLFRHESA